MIRIFLTAAILLFTAGSASAQHDGHDHNNHTGDSIKTDTTHIPLDTTHKHPTEDHTGHNMHSMDNAPMSHIYSLNLPMNRNASGTAWLPDNSPMYGYMLHSNDWMLMFHGNIFMRYNKQDLFNDGQRGGEKWDAPNWFMAMAQRKIGSTGLLGLSVMLSLDPLTVGGEGYPLLFQTGETWKGKPLMDRQHPHNFFSELAIGYTQALSKDIDLNLYLGYPGEPALGPVAFMHRPSAFPNPDAPLSHHWQDATHITFGVGTIGLRYKNVKLEGSVFTGKEPGEDRYAFEKPLFDSYSLRLSVNPTKEFAMQVSHGSLKEPEALHPGDDMKKTTASVIHTRDLKGIKANISSTVVWGMNSSHGDNTHSLLLESAFNYNKATLYGRFEFVQKDREELGFTPSPFETEHIKSINAVTLGFSMNVFKFNNTNASLGIQFSKFIFSDRELQGVYGNSPISGEVYLRIYPGQH